MSGFDYFSIIIIMLALWFITNSHTQLAEERILAAINDNGCASHQALVPTVERIDNYNLDSLGGE